MSKLAIPFVIILVTVTLSLSLCPTLASPMDFQAMIKAERARIRADMLKDRTKEHPGQLLSIPKSVDLGSGVSYCSDFFSEGEAAELVNSIEATPQSEWATLAKRRLLNLGGVPHPSGSWTEDLPGDIAGLSISRLTSMGVFTTDEPPNQILLNEYRDGAGIDAHNDGPLFEPIACIVSLESDAVIHFFDPEPPLSPSISAPTPPSSRRASQLMPLSEKCAGSVAGQSTQPVCSVILRRNSCLVFKGPIAYQRWTHAVADSMVDVVDVTRVANAQQAPVAVGESEDQGLRYVKRSPRRLSLTLRRLHRVDRHCGTFDVLSSEVEAERLRRRIWFVSSVSE